MKSQGGKGKTPRMRIFWRIYLYGLMFIAAAACTVALMMFLTDNRPPPMHEGIVRLIEEDCASNQARLKARLEDISSVIHSSMAVYSMDGTIMVSAGLNPPQPLSPEKARTIVARSGKSGGFPLGFAVPVSCGTGFQGYLVTDFKWRPRMWPLAVTALLVFGLLAVVLVPLAHTIANPIEKITETARLLGNGRFSARTGVRGMDEIGVLAGTFDEMAERIERLLRSERELLANISHEIRTPLARIHLAVELCSEDGVMLEELRGHLKGITGDLDELDRLIDDVLMATRLDLAAQDGSGAGFRLRKTPLLIQSVAGEAAERFRDKWPGYRLDVKESGAAVSVYADPVMLRRVLDNILDNAAKYSGAGSTVAMTIGFQEDSVLIEVRDNGIGIPDEDMPRLFEPFFRTDRARARNTGGLGLGLTLCKKIVEAHGGHISVSKNPGGGSIFSMVLPSPRPPDPSGKRPV